MLCRTSKAKPPPPILFGVVDIPQQFIIEMQDTGAVAVCRAAVVHYDVIVEEQVPAMLREQVAEMLADLEVTD